MFATQPDRATALAAGITDPSDRAEAMIGLITALTTAGEHERASALAEQAATTTRAYLVVGGEIVTPLTSS